MCNHAYCNLYLTKQSIFLYTTTMSFIPRIAQTYFEEMLGSSKVVIVLGARQVGKTTLVQRVLEGRRTLFLNFDIEVDKQRFLAAATLSPKEAIMSLGAPAILVVDEAQRIPETGRIIKGWYDAKVPTEMVLLGSSSLNLLDQSAESLTGRNVKLFLTPLFFREILSVQPWYSEAFTADQLQKQFSDQMKTILLQTMVFGSYPEAVTTSNKPQYLTNLVSDYLLKDILQIGLVKSPEVVRKLLLLLAYQVGSEVSINELANNLNVARLTVERYLDLLEQTFVIFKLPAFSTNPRKEIAKSNKIYFWDTGVRNALLNELNISPFRSDIGKLWENWVIAEFAKENVQSGNRKSLYFWRSRAGSEIDLVIKEGEALKAYEIKWSGKKSATRAFSERYKVTVDVVDSHRPLVEL